MVLQRKFHEFLPIHLSCLGIASDATASASGVSFNSVVKHCDFGVVIYDQLNNPTGTQRDLSPKHAKEAYE